eukprot:CAMPEP_0115033282 /NCGR_PEP_ID=MMETSP0216-20121206/39746_1 /TAXON_ID=223996 /ORGANISM="Protocruzia adherens, Strain Boccale" /LENGTH=42 /DNA_ID= /DNA_START= /DNA_END= /DNA_ORIENTATION=
MTLGKPASELREDEVEGKGHANDESEDAIVVTVNGHVGGNIG